MFVSSHPKHACFCTVRGIKRMISFNFKQELIEHLKAHGVRHLRNIKESRNESEPMWTLTWRQCLKKDKPGTLLVSSLIDICYFKFFMYNPSRLFGLQTFIYLKLICHKRSWALSSGKVKMKHVNLSVGSALSFHPASVVTELDVLWPFSLDSEYVSLKLFLLEKAKVFTFFFQSYVSWLILGWAWGSLIICCQLWVSV